MNSARRAEGSGPQDWRGELERERRKLESQGEPLLKRVSETSQESFSEFVWVASETTRNGNK